ncbi:hypothetical protein RAS2_07250 [Phycisphaerae bacterium RAS2]|nr:hypothetical protein RAS2_07250 [Phycisphaerae bacterium RAS2]
MSFKVNSLRLIGQTYGGYDPDSDAPIHTLADVLPLVDRNAIVTALAVIRQDWTFGGTNGTVAFENLMNEIHTALTGINSLYHLYYQAPFYMAILDKYGNVVGHDTIAQIKYDNQVVEYQHVSGGATRYCAQSHIFASIGVS